MMRSLTISGFLTRGLVIVLCLLIFFYCSPVQAQDWDVLGRGEGMTLSVDEDDGLNGVGEVSLSIQWTHLDEERNVLTQRTTTKEVAHNWDVSGSTLTGLTQELSTEECDGSDYIYVTARLTESDMLTGFDNILATVAGIAVAITVATILAPTGPGAAAGAVLAAKVTGAVVGAASAAFLKSFSGVEDLGKIEGKKLEFGANDFFVNGPGGGGSFKIEDLSEQTSEWNLNCFEGLFGGTSDDPVDPDTAVNSIYPVVLDVLALVPTINREDFSGSDADTEIDFLRRTVAETVTGMAEVAAVYFVYQAQTGFLGAPAALPLLASGQAHHAAGDYELAVADYREAFRIAYTAIWDGNFGPGYLPASHLTMVGSIRLVSPESHHDFSGWTLGIGPTEYLDYVDVDGQDSGMEFFGFPGVARTAVVLAGDLPPDYELNSTLGLGRISAGVIQGPDGNCDVDHLEEGSIGGGIFIDGQGPYFEPDPAGCGYGEVIETYMDIPMGGVPFGAGPDPDGIFTLALTLTDELLPGEYPLTVTAYVTDPTRGTTREISAPLTLLVPEVGQLFADGFEGGDSTEWSVTSQ